MRGPTGAATMRLPGASSENTKSQRRVDLRRCVLGAGEPSSSSSSLSSRVAFFFPLPLPLGCFFGGWLGAGSSSAASSSPSPASPSPSSPSSCSSVVFLRTRRLPWSCPSLKAASPTGRSLVRLFPDVQSSLQAGQLWLRRRYLLKQWVWRRV